MCFSVCILLEDDTNCRTYVRKKVRALMDLNVAGGREAKGVAWETTAQTHMAVAFWV